MKPLEEVERIMDSLRTAPTKEELPPSARPEVVTTSTKSKRVCYSKDSDCGLYSNGSNDTEDKYNSHEDMRNSSAEFIEESEEDIYEDLPNLTTDSPTTCTGDEEEPGDDNYKNLPYLVTDSPDTGYNENKITDIITDMNNTELENFMQAATELASSDSPIEGLKPLPQWFQEGYVGEKKTPEISMHVGDTVI